MTRTADVDVTPARKGSAPSKKREPRTPVQSRVRNRPRPAIIALSIALILAAGLAAAYLYATTGRTTQVFSAATSISRGDVIRSEDLTTVEIPDNQQIPSFTIAQPDAVVGKIATVDLPDGTLISPNNIAANAGPVAGSSIVGISLTAAQLPPYALVSGDPVRVVDTPTSQGNPPEETPETISATIVSVTEDTVTGNTVVAVAVDEATAPDLAARAATGRVALILDSLKD
jgi:hypothetical protein